MSGFVGLNELFIKLQLKFEFKLSELEKTRITRLLYPLSNKNRLTLSKEDFAKALEPMHLETNTRYTEAIKQFLINYLEKNIQDMI